MRLIVVDLVSNSTTAKFVSEADVGFARTDAVSAEEGPRAPAAGAGAGAPAAGRVAVAARAAAELTANARRDARYAITDHVSHHALSMYKRVDAFGHGHELTFSIICTQLMNVCTPL